MNQKYKYIIPEGVAQSFYINDDKVVFGPGEHKFEEYHYCSSTMLIRPHREFETVVLKTIKNPNSTEYTIAFCLFSFMCEIVNPTKYVNCHVPVTYLASGSTNNSLDGEEYVSDMCTNIIFQKLCALTFEEIEALKGTEIDLSREMCFPEYQQKMFDNTGAIITQLKVIIAEVAKGEGV